VTVPGAFTSMGEVRVTDYGITVEVEAPPASEVTDEAFPMSIFLAPSPSP
jgi:hypothetical protein